MESLPTPPPREALSLTDGVQAWSALCERLAQRARLDAEIVELASVVQRSGTIDAIEGVPLDTALNLVHPMPRADRSMQLTAADLMADMPSTARLFKQGQLSWGQVRSIVVDARRLTRDQRGALDARIGASADRFAKLDPDDAIDVVRIAVEELRDVRPGSRRPIDHVHHLDKRRRGHHPDALVGLADASHQRVHRHGWAVTVDPQTGEATFARGERRWVTLPRRTRLRRLPPGDRDGAP